MPAKRERAPLPEELDMLSRIAVAADLRDMAARARALPVNGEFDRAVHEGLASGLERKADLYDIPANAE